MPSGASSSSAAGPSNATGTSPSVSSENPTSAEEGFHKGLVGTAHSIVRQLLGIVTSKEQKMKNPDILLCLDDMTPQPDPNGLFDPMTNTTYHRPVWFNHLDPSAQALLNKANVLVRLSGRWDHAWESDLEAVLERYYYSLSNKSVPSWAADHRIRQWDQRTKSLRKCRESTHKFDNTIFNSCAEADRIRAVVIGEDALFPVLIRHNESDRLDPDSMGFWAEDYYNTFKPPYKPIDIKKDDFARVELGWVSDEAQFYYMMYDDYIGIKMSKKRGFRYRPDRFYPVPFHLRIPEAGAKRVQYPFILPPGSNPKQVFTLADPPLIPGRPTLQELINKDLDVDLKRAYHRVQYRLVYAGREEEMVEQVEQVEQEE